MRYVADIFATIGRYIDMLPSSKISKRTTQEHRINKPMTRDVCES